MPCRQATTSYALARSVVLAVLGLCLAGCERSKQPESASTGPNPTLPQPTEAIIPTVNIAPAKGWPQGAIPKSTAGFSVRAFANDLHHPRWLYVLPNGDVLVAESNAPERPEEGRGIKGWIYQWAQKRAGAGVKSPDRITLLRDSDGDGTAETRTPFLQGLHSPFGMALIGSDHYVADTDAIRRFGYTEAATEIKSAGIKVADLPGGSLNHHWTKNIIASPDGKHLYATVGSNSNAGENGMLLGPAC
jgi:glucose/arabinose dehydrogenase